MYDDICMSFLGDMQPQPGAKILCAKFGNFTKTKFASGDDKNNVQIWKLGTDKP